jgi:hypothetical protein
LLVSHFQRLGDFNAPAGLGPSRVGLIMGAAKADNCLLRIIGLRGPALADDTDPPRC